MHFGGAMFFTDYSMSAPEHSHIPLARKTPFPGGGDLPKQYYDAMDQFVVLAAAEPGDQDHQTGYRRGAHSAAGRDPDREVGRLDSTR
jgi:hypothetical protein